MLTAVTLALPLGKGMLRWVVFCQHQAFCRLYSFIPTLRIFAVILLITCVFRSFEALLSPHCVTSVYPESLRTAI